MWKKSLSGRDICNPVSIAALFTIVKTWKQSNCPSCGILIQSNISHKKEGNPAIFDNIDWPWGHYPEWNKSDTDKYCKIWLICGIFKSHTHRNNRNVLPEMGWVREMRKCWPNFHQKINKLWGSYYSILQLTIFPWNYILYMFLKFAERLSRKTP